MTRPTARRLPVWLVPLLLATAGAGLGLVTSLQARDRILYREAAGQELPGYFLARAIAAPRPGEPAAPVSAPLHALLLGALGAGRDGGVPAARRLQLVLLGAALPLLSLFAARRGFGPAAGTAAGVLTLVLGPVWVHLTWLLPFAWQAALGLAAVCVAAGRGRGVIRSLLVGLLTGLARLFGAAWAPFLALAWVVAHLTRRRFLSGLAVAAGASILFLAPLLNRAAAVPVASPPLLMGGMESALGFHDGATGIDPRRGERGAWRWTTPRDLVNQLDREADAPVTARPASAAWYGKTIRWSLGHPLAAISLVVRKAWYLLGGYDPPSPDSLGFRASQTIPWARPLLPVAALVGGLGLAGLLAVRRWRPSDREAPDLAPILTLLVATLLAGVLYYVRSGDRLALLLAMTGPAGWVVCALLAPRRRRATAAGSDLAATGAEKVPGSSPGPGGAPRRGIMAAGAVAAVVLMALPWLTLAPRAESAADDRHLLASTMERLGRQSEAMTSLEQVLRLDPAHAPARLGLAAGLARDGLYDQAVGEAGRVVREQPDMAVAVRFLAVVCQQSGRYQESADAWERLTRLEPRNHEAWNNLGTLYASLGRYDDAVAALKRALVIDPGYQSARINLAELERRGPEGLKGATPTLPGAGGSSSDLSRGIAAALNSLQAGDLAAAEKVLGDLRATYGASPDLDLASGHLAARKGEIAVAIELYERSRGQLRDNPILLNNLAICYARTGRLAEAVQLWEEALRINPGDQMARANLEAAQRQLGAMK